MQHFFEFCFWNNLGSIILLQDFALTSKWDAQSVKIPNDFLDCVLIFSNKQKIFSGAHQWLNILLFNFLCVNYVVTVGK